MNRQRHTLPRRRSRRGGFSLVELMIVIVVIALLIGMAFPAYNAVQRRAQVTAVSVEIKNLEEAIARFEQEYGAPPPSFVMLFEAGPGSGGVTNTAPHWNDDNSGTPVNQQRNRIISRSRIKAVWPQFDFNFVGDSTDARRDINGNGLDNDVIYLNGAECLVFFLGGVFAGQDTNGDGTIDSWIPEGFSTNPTSPFSAGGSRKGPFYQFDPQRLVDIDGDGMPEYLDSLPNQTKPYQYFSSYGGTGYLPCGLDGEYGPPYPTTASGGALDNETLPGGLVSHYMLVDANEKTPPPPWPSSPPMLHPTPASPSAVHKPQGYQIISPGFDGEFGLGGTYTPGKALSGRDNAPYADHPFYSRRPTQNDPPGRPDVIQFEFDNITNFATGTLQ